MSDPSQDWSFYTRSYGEHLRAFFKFHVPACDARNQRPSSGRRVVAFSPAEEISPSGGPSEHAFQRLMAIEHRLMSVLAHGQIPHWLVGTYVCDATRELVFQIDEPHTRAFDDACAIVERELGGTAVIAYPGWTYFNETISPDEEARSQISNRELLEALKAHGADLSRRYVLDHSFVGPASALEALRRELVDAFAFRETGRSEGHLTVSKPDVLVQEAIDHRTRILRHLAQRHGATYDGWGTFLGQGPNAADECDAHVQARREATPEVAMLDAVARGESVVAVLRRQIPHTHAMVLLRGIRTAFGLDLAGAKRVQARALEAPEAAADVEMDRELAALVEPRRA